MRLTSHAHPASSAAALTARARTATVGGTRRASTCAGCVGNADHKNPPGQAPSGTDSNKGYECDANSGIGKTNPAHTGCTQAPLTPTTTIMLPTTTTTTTPSSPPAGTQKAVAGGTKQPNDAIRADDAGSGESAVHGITNR